MKERFEPVARTAPVPAARSPRIAVIIPCLNEAGTIGKVVSEFRAAIPEAIVVVVDNRSSDGTAAIARAAGAEVIRENRRGKGHALQTAFARVDADFYVLADGDDNCPAADAPRLLEPLLTGEADFVVGERFTAGPPASSRRLQHAGNRLIVALVNTFFRTSARDVLSGYRALTRHVVDNVPIVSPGFEVETELTIQALERGFSIKEVPVSFRPRPAGSPSKIRPFRDGYRILMTIAILLRDHRPLFFFSSISGAFLTLAIALGALSFTADWTRDTRLASMLLAIGCMVVSAVVATGGLLLNAVNVRVRELHGVVIRAGRQQMRPGRQGEPPAAS
ncbi:MAG: glycosyltransferase family 2 protein [Vicinamibacterales bacterium]